MSAVRRALCWALLVALLTTIALMTSAAQPEPVDAPFTPQTVAPAVIYQP